MRSAHSVSLQIYVFPFTCFAFSLFFCHFVSPSPSLLPSFPHRATSSRSVSRGLQGGNRRSVSLAGKSPPLSRRGPARRVRLHLIDADLYDGTAGWGGEVLFHLAPIVFFSPYSILPGVVRSHCVQLHKRGVGVVLTPFGQCHCTTEIRGVIPLEIPVFAPPHAASLRRYGELGRGGSFSFRPHCLLFPLFYIAWRCAQPLRAIAQGGYWHFVCSVS